jgi:hypothetical protein
MGEPQPYHWYCCQCGNGPLSWALLRSCIDCQHQICTGCKYEFLEEADLPTNICRADVSPTQAVPSSDSGLDCVDCMNSTSDDQSSNFVSVVSEGSSSLKLESESEHDEPLPAPSLLPSQHITALPENLPSGPEGQPVDGETLWVCSECGGGSWLASTTVSCLNCGHFRCVNCSSWEV